MTNLDNISTMSDEELVTALEQMNAFIEEQEGGVSVIKDELMDRLNQRKISGLKTSRYFINKVKRTSWQDVLLSTAEALGAIKKAVDTNKLKQISESGVKIKGMKVSYFLRMDKIKEEV